MAARNDKRQRANRPEVNKQVETGTNLTVKLAILALAGFAMYIEFQKPGSINPYTWPFLIGAFFGKEAFDRVIGGKR